MPVWVDCVFTVDSTNALGISSLKGPYVQNVYMHTSATPAAGNPNPAAGTIVVQLQDSFSQLYIASHAIASPSSGSDVKIDNSAMTAGVAYTITTLGDATAAKWHAIGVPAGVVPAVGVSFIAASDGGTGNTLTSAVQASAAAGSGIFSIELLQKASASLSPAPSANQGFGAQLILQCRKDSASDAPVIAAPADGSIIRLAFLLSNSSIMINGD